MEEKKEINMANATFIQDKFFSNLETLSTIAEKGGAHSLLLMGMGVITTALFTKSKIFFYLEPIEFIAFIIIGFLLILSGALIKFFVYKIQMDMERDRNKLGTDLLKSSQDVAVELTNNKQNNIDHSKV